MIRRIISLVVFVLVANAGMRVAIVFYHSEQFKDAVREIALFGGTKTDEVLTANVLDTAKANEITGITEDDINISRETLVGSGVKVTITVTYGFDTTLAPGYKQHFEFTYTTPRGI